MRVIHRNKEGICPSCDLKFLQMDERLVDLFKKIVEKFKDAHISWAFRGEKDQNKMYLEGKSKLVFPLSKHNFLDSKGKPSSQAMDLFRLNSEGDAEFSNEWYAAIASYLKEQGISFRWGGDFKTLNDSNHFELKGDE